MTKRDRQDGRASALSNSSSSTSSSASGASGAPKSTKKQRKGTKSTTAKTATAAAATTAAPGSASASASASAGSASADGDANWEDLRDDDGNFRKGARIFCRYEGDGTWRVAKVVSSKVDEAGGVRYYISYADFNRRMDTWVSAEMASDHDPTGAMRRADVVEFVEEDYGESNGMDEASIREHEQITLIKNVEKIELGRNVIKTWYFSPIPRELYPDGPIDTLYMSDFTLDMFRFPSELARHYRKSPVRHPPGDEIYRDREAKLSMFEIDGGKSKIYAENLSYLAKFFLDHKTLYHDCSVFLFYVLCEYDDKGYHLVGYFSKEKYSDQGNNLACILTLPAFQRRGFGRFLIDFSYELSKKEEKVGSPEKPLSDLGQLSYRSYWCRSILEALLALKAESTVTSVLELTKATSIKTEDVTLALKFLGLVKLHRGRWVLCADEALLRRKLLEFPVKGPRVNPEHLHWAPLKVDVKKDKWSIRSKRKVDTPVDPGPLILG